MPSLLKFGSHSGKRRSLLALFILHALQESPKSGYDIRREIAEKSGGQWIPSKGTLYPVLHRLEEERLIAVQATGKRSRTLYGPTPKGRATLRAIRERGKESHKSMEAYRNLILDIFGPENARIKALQHDIQAALEGCLPGKEGQAERILETCLEELKRNNACSHTR